MPGKKLLINGTGKELRVTLVVRRGDMPDQEAGKVQVVLGTGLSTESEENQSRQEVMYGDSTDIYLNGLEAVMIEDGSVVRNRYAVVERGSALDNMLNQNDTIEFLYDGHMILFSGRNSDQKPFTFPASHSSRAV